MIGKLGLKGAEASNLESFESHDKNPERPSESTGCYNVHSVMISYAIIKKLKELRGA